MASLDFEQEKQAFEIFYDRNREHFEDARDTFIQIISSLLKDADVGEETKIEGRIKDKHECIRKFIRKYRVQLEVDEQPYEIKDHLTDLIGIRIICLYEDQIQDVYHLLNEKFSVIEITDKTSETGHSDDVFGYKGIHMDLTLNNQMSSIPEYQPFATWVAEVQIRSLIQDAWCVLDHKIKYKKSIPNTLKRRINILSALFELADQEFMEIRNATNELVQQATIEPMSDLDKEDKGSLRRMPGDKRLNAFNFMRIARHFFRELEFDSYKVDDFVQEILKIENGFQKHELHVCIMENLKIIKSYGEELVSENTARSFGPFTSIRHCLYLHKKKVYRRILSKKQRDHFEAWLKKT